MVTLKSGDPNLIMGEYINIMIEVEEYVLGLNNLISNLQKLYNKNEVEFKSNKNILFQLNLLLENHKLLQLCLTSRQRGVLALDDSNLTRGTQRKGGGEPKK